MRIYVKYIFGVCLLVGALCPLSGQTGAHRIGQVLVKGNGIAANVVPYAAIKICVAGTQCSTISPVYSDQSLTHVLPQPISADASGNYNYYTPAGCVDEQISAPGSAMIWQYNVCPSTGTIGTGSVNSVSVATVNGFQGTVTNPTSTPVINMNVDGSHYLPTTSDESNWNGKQAALGFTPENIANKDTASGYAGLTAGTLLKTSEFPAFTGDATSTAGTTALTLATVNSAPGSCGDATHVCSVVTNGKGLVASQTAIAINSLSTLSVGDLSPLFTSTVTNPTTTPSVTFTQSPAPINSVLAGAPSGSAVAPTFQTSPTFSAANLTNFPTFNQNTTGTASNLSGTPALPNGTTATTQTVGDNSTKIATDAFVLANSSSAGVSSINSTTGAFTFTGSGVSCTSTTCTFSGTGTGIGSITWALPAWLTASPSTISATGTQTFSATTGLTANEFLATPNGSTGALSVRAIVSADIPTLNQNTTGTAANLSGTPALPSGTTATTQTSSDNSTKLATTAFVQANAYSLPQATTSVLGGIKPDGTTCTATAGVLTCAGSGGISGLTAGYVPVATSPTAIGNSLLDYGITTASIFTFGAGVTINDGTGHGGGFTGVEGTALSGASSHDALWADSTDHRFKMNNNNGGATDVVGFSDQASSSLYGVVKVDGTTITATGGVISAVGGGGGGTNFNVPRNQSYGMETASQGRNRWDVFGLYGGPYAGTETWSATMDPAGYAGATLPTGTTANTSVGYSDGTALATDPSFNSIVRFTQATAMQAWVGLCNVSCESATNVLNPTSTGTRIVGFRHFDGTDTNWTCVISNGTSVTTLDSGVALNTTSAQVMDVIYSSGTPQLYINHTQVCGSMVTTNKPTATEPLGGLVAVQNTTTTSVSIIMQSMYVGQN